MNKEMEDRARRAFEDDMSGDHGRDWFNRQENWEYVDPQAQRAWRAWRRAYLSGSKDQEHVHAVGSHEQAECKEAFNRVMEKLDWFRKVCPAEHLGKDLADALTIEFHKNADARKVLDILSTGEWMLIKSIPVGYLTDEANAKLAWVATRQAVPFCDGNGCRTWTGPTALGALQSAMKDLGIGGPNG